MGSLCQESEKYYAEVP